MTREAAESVVADFERRIRAHLRRFSPEEVIPELARRHRLAQMDVEAFSRHPPHFLVHALEANCAYYEPWRYEPFEYNDFVDTIAMFNDFLDPTLMNTLRDGSNMFEFEQFMHRTQMELQGEGSHLLFGRALRMYGDNDGHSPATTAFVQRYGLSVRDWLKLVMLFFASTGETRDKLLRKPAITPRQLESAPEVGIPLSSVSAFLREVARTPRELGDSYRRIREQGATDRKFGPLTWSQRRPSLATYPIVHMALGYLVPSPPLLLRLALDGLDQRLDAINSDDVRADVGARFEKYVADLFRHHLPAIKVVDSNCLRVVAEPSCDFAVDLPDALLLIECKAVTLDPDLVTAKAVIQSAAVHHMVDGFVQVIHTAARIKRGGYDANLLPRNKPLLGIVVTLGTIPGADNEAIREETSLACERAALSADSIASLSLRPQPFDADALEYFVLLLQRGAITAHAAFSEKLAGR